MSNSTTATPPASRPNDPAIEVKGDSQNDAWHQGLVFERVRFSGPAKAQIDGLKDSLFDHVSFSGHGAANPWQITGSVGLTFKDVQLDADRLVGPVGEAAQAVEAALDAATAALCAEAVGAVDALLAHTSDHLRTRKQFGAPLAKFQVLQHRVADIAIALEQLKSMACAAAMAVQAGEPVQRRRLPQPRGADRHRVEELLGLGDAVPGLLLAAGLLVGIGAGLIAELFDQSVKNADDLEAKVGVPSISSIPTISKRLTPPGAWTWAVSPSSLPISARAIGLEMLIRPSLMSASSSPTIW